MAYDILIVDDEPDIRLLIDGILRDEGYDTIEILIGGRAGAEQQRVLCFATRCRGATSVENEDRRPSVDLS